MYNTNWENISDKALDSSNAHYSGADIKKPVALDRMLEYARKLSEGFPEVRVDFYEINGVPILGELTFTTGYGSYKESFYEYLGGKVDLSNIK